MKNEVVEVCEPRILYPQRLLEVTEEYEDSLPKDLMEHHIEEREEANQGSSHSIEAESYIEERFIELPTQEASNDENTPTITQFPILDVKEVKATNESTKRRIVTKIQGTTSMKKKRSTTTNPTLAAPTSKAN
ncbi:hypothetical protein AHAS_Ahas04G0099900 [Arachis hypogaea]